MRRWFALPVAAWLAGCGGGSSYVHSDTTLGRVVVYRNGVAYFERYAQIEDESLKLAVPADKVDDFLKSLTVVDVKTGKPAPVAYPTSGTPDGTGLIDMKISLPGPKPHQVRLSYVTAVPSWKPSYRVVVGKNSKVDLQAWAIVDNTSGEDWNNVKLGVGSSSAMSFRFDLRSLRVVERETLQSNDLFAIAPPSGGSVHGGREEAREDGSKKLAELDESVVGNLNAEFTARVPITNSGARGGAQRSLESVTDRTATEGAQGNPNGRGILRPPPPPPQIPGRTLAEPAPPPAPPPNSMAAVAERILRDAKKSQVTIEGYANANDKDRNAAALQRANNVREQLIMRGVDPARLVAVARPDEGNDKGGVRILEAPPPARGAQVAKPKEAPADPIGTSHFESGIPMSVPRGSSAMVSILRQQADGEVVYLYDPESPRGNASFAFKAVRLKNPTDSALESGPVSVFGEGRFIGEGLSEPIPARTTAFIPFALDRQILVEAKNDEHDEITRMLTVQRGIFSAEVQRTRRATWTLYNRLGERATVYVRHTAPPGYTLSSSALAHSPEKIGAAHLFRVDLKPGEKRDLTVEEQAPETKMVDVRAPGGMDLVRVYLTKGAMSGPLKSQMSELLKAQQDIGTLEQRITSTREQMQDYRARMDELHAQLVTLRAVKTAGPLMQNLEQKMREVSDKLSKATIEVVALQEKLMVARVRLQDGVADLTLAKRDEKAKTP